LKKIFLYIFFTSSISIYSQSECIDSVLKNINDFRWKQKAIRIPESSFLEIGKIYNPPAINFGLASPEFADFSKDSLKKLAVVLKRNLDKVMLVAVHTQAKGDSIKNKQLSAQRAKNIFNFLTNECGVPKENLQHKGYGSAQQLYEVKKGTKNEVEPLKASNQRTEIRVIKKIDFMDSVSFRKNYYPFYKEPPVYMKNVSGEFPPIIKIPEIRFTLSGGNRPMDKDSLIAIADFIKANPFYFFEISSHTDSRGKAAANKTLSHFRAKSVLDYLIQGCGVDACRVTSNGYGSEYPVISNDIILKAKTNEEKEALHQLNRRIELRVLGRN